MGFYDPDPPAQAGIFCRMILPEMRATALSAQQLRLQDGLGCLQLTCESAGGCDQGNIICLVQLPCCHQMLHLLQCFCQAGFTAADHGMCSHERLQLSEQFRAAGGPHEGERTAFRRGSGILRKASGSSAGLAAEDQTIGCGETADAVGSVHTPGDLTGCIESGNLGGAIRIDENY